jgi:hypothetical protein
MTVIPPQPIPKSPGDLLTFLGQKLNPVWLASRTPGSLSVPRQVKDGEFLVHAAFSFTEAMPAGVSLPQAKATNAITIV